MKHLIFFLFLSFFFAQCSSEEGFNETPQPIPSESIGEDFEDTPEEMHYVLISTSSDNLDYNKAILQKIETENNQSKLRVNNIYLGLNEDKKTCS